MFIQCKDDNGVTYVKCSLCDQNIYDNSDHRCEQMAKHQWLEEGNEWDSLGGGLEVSVAYFLHSLAENVARPGMIGFDTGCYTGWTASCVWSVFAANGGHFYCVDWFKGGVNSQIADYQWGQFPAGTVLLQLLKNIEIADALNYVSVVIGTSWEPAALLPDRSIDYVYIGGDHRYSGIKRDILAWLPKVRSGGVICGHAFTGDVEMGSKEWERLCGEPELDYYIDGKMHFGVVRAVKEMLPGYTRFGQIWAKVVE